MKDKLSAQKRIAAVHDLSGLGKCSLTIALPVISASGVECSCIPTALLSTHTGEFTGYTVKDLSDQMLPIARHWRREGARFDGIYSGYLASPEQEKLLEELIDELSGPDTLVIVDPVMADNGRYYHSFDDSMCVCFRQLCTKAHIITPNVTEAALLGGLPYKKPPHDSEYIDDLLKSIEAFGSKAVIITGVQPSGDEVGIVALDKNTGKMFSAMRPVREGVFYGTGDLFASSLAALLVRGAGLGEAVEIAASLVADSIDRTALRGTPRRFGVAFEGALPDYIHRVDKLFK